MSLITESSARRRILYIVSEDLVRVASQLPSNKNRSVLVHSLIGKLGLLTPQNGVRVMRPPRATRAELMVYHDSAYVDWILDPRNARSEAANAYFGIEDVG
jgi:histone deacetylase 8